MLIGLGVGGQRHRIHTLHLLAERWLKAEVPDEPKVGFIANCWRGGGAFLLSADNNRAY